MQNAYAGIAHAQLRAATRWLSLLTLVGELTVDRTDKRGTKGKRFVLLVGLLVHAETEHIKPIIANQKGYFLKNLSS